MSASAIRAGGITPDIHSDYHGFPAVSFDIPQHACACLVGPDEALVQNYFDILTGVNDAGTGDLQILERQGLTRGATDWKWLRTQTAIIDGHAPLISMHHGLMNTMLPALYHRSWSLQDTAGRARQLLDDVEADFDFTALPAYLTRFERAQVSLARALILAPRILYLSDPFFELAADESRRYSNLIFAQQKKYQFSIIACQTNWGFVRRRADMIIYISPQKCVSFPDWNTFSQSDNNEISAFLDSEGIRLPTQQHPA